jgi:hypothetical protein
MIDSGKAVSIVVTNFFGMKLIILSVSGIPSFD